MSDDPDADVMKVVIDKVGDIPRGFCQRMTFVAARLVVEELPAALGRVVNRVLLSSNEVIERTIKRQLGSFVGRDGAQQVGAVGRAAKDDTESLLVFFDRCDLRHRRIQIGLTHLNGVDNRECRLLLERVHPTVPELSLVIESVQNGWGIALADAAFDAEGGGPPVGKGKFWIMACAVQDGAVKRETRVQEKCL